MPKTPTRGARAAATSPATPAQTTLAAAQSQVVISGDVPEPTSYRGRNVIELDIPQECWIRFMGVSYSIVEDLSLPQGTFGISVSAPSDPLKFICDLYNSKGALVVTHRTIRGTTYSSPLQFDGFPGSGLSVRLNYENSGVPDILLPLDFGESLRTALDRRRILFRWAWRPVVSTRQREELLRSPAAVPVFLYGYEDRDGGYEILASRVPPIALTDQRITEAFAAAQRTGHFDPEVFPNVGAGDDQASRAAVIATLAELPSETVVRQLKSGRRLTIRRATNGQYTYRFIPAPRRAEPRLLLVEYYRLSSFPARYGAGRTIKTFSLLPGEKTSIRLNTYKRSSESMQRSSSILDSTTDETESEFERTVMSENSSQESASSSFEYHAEAEAEGKASWGWGSASAKVSGGVKGGSNAAREEFAKNLSNAVSHNAARASSRRDVQVDTSMDVKLESGEESAVERTLENINVSRTLNFVFRQMNQEFVTLLHLVDVRVAFFNGHGESRDEVPLSELDRLLGDCILPERVDEVRELVLGEVRGIRDYLGQERRDFVQTVTLQGDGGRKVEYTRVTPGLTSVHQVAEAGPQIRVPGIILAADTHVVRTDGVVVDTFLGEGNGLDSYSTGLQEQSVRAREIDNRLQELEAARLELATQIVRDNDTKRAELYRRLFVRPQIVNQIEQAAVNGQGVDGQLTLAPSS